MRVRRETVHLGAEKIWEIKKSRQQNRQSFGVVFCLFIFVIDSDKRHPYGLVLCFTYILWLPNVGFFTVNLRIFSIMTKESESEEDERDGDS